jgi:hypothetical protein
LVRYFSSLAVVDFIDSAGKRFNLIGDQLKTAPIKEYIDEEVRLFINSRSDWSWLPLDEPENGS